MKVIKIIIALLFVIIAGTYVVLFTPINKGIIAPINRVWKIDEL